MGKDTELMVLGAAIIPIIKFIAVFLSVMNAATAMRQAGRRGKQKQPSRGHLLNTRSMEWIKRLAYGPCRVGGNIEYRAISGSDNRYLHQIIKLGWGPIEGVFRQDGTIFSTPAAALPAGSNPALIYLDGKLWTDTPMAGNCYFEFFRGDAIQAVCATLNSAISEFTDPYRYEAYLYCRFQFDADKFLHEPVVTVKLAGLRCYDPTAATLAYTENFALHAYDMLTRPRELAGMGLDNWHAAPPASPRINVASVESARAYCAAEGWEGGQPIEDDTDFFSNLSKILPCYRGDIVGASGEYKFVYRDLNYESVAMTLDETDVVERSGHPTLTLRPRNKYRAMPNTLKINHYSEELNWQEYEHPFHDGAAIVADGGVREQRVQCMGLNQLDKVQVMGGYLLERARWGHAGTFSGAQALAQLEPGDLIRLTHSLSGYSDQYLRVIDLGLDDQGEAALAIEEEALAMYNRTYNTAELIRYTPPILDLSASPPSVYGGSITEEQISNRLRTGTALIVDFSPPDNFPFWRGVRVWVSIGDALSWKYQTEVKDRYELFPSQEGVHYYFRLQSVNINDVAEDFDNAYTLSLYVQGSLNNVPANVTGFVAAATGDSVSLRADNPFSDDIIAWEVRLGDAFNGGIFITRLSDPSYTLSGVRPGTHTFHMAALNNAGNYSATPVSSVAKINTPGWLTADFSQTYDYTTGDFTNAEQDTYNSQHILKCSHTGGVLTGSWTSPTYDRGSLATVRVWIEFSTAFIATSSSWNGVLPSPNDWDSVNINTEQWAQIFQPSQAAQLKASLRYSENGSDWTELAGFELNFFEVYARFFQIKKEITDPTADSNLYTYPVTLKSFTGPI